jgi:hypothetical protein
VTANGILGRATGKNFVEHFGHSKVCAAISVKKGPHTVSHQEGGPGHKDEDFGAALCEKEHICGRSRLAATYCDHLRHHYDLRQPATSCDKVVNLYPRKTAAKTGSGT